MYAEIKTARDPEQRLQIVENRTTFDNNPHAFLAAKAEEQAKKQSQIVKAQQILNEVNIDRDLRLKISTVCADLNIDGLRGDIVTTRAAKAYAASDGRKDVEVDDIKAVISLCIRHRLRKDPLESIDSGFKVIKTFNQVFGIEEE
jgi:magnesium chelatase subunit I